MKWILPSQPENKDLIEWIFENRNIKDKNKFFFPTLDHFHDPFLMYGMKDAVKALAEAIKKKKKIFIHGDFDVDGITATSIMWQFLYKDLKADVLPYIPSRFEEGYGLSDESIQSIINSGGELLISVDCGVKDIEAVEKYKDKIDFIITDHHTLLPNDNINNFENSKAIGEHLISKSALAVVHPGLNNQYPFKEICGAMVSWKVCSALNTYLGKGIDMSKYLDLVALGTTCDIMPLIDENRVAVKLGLEKLKITQNKGLQALLNIARVDKAKVSTYHLGYIIGPRLNAAGRLKDAMDAVKLLSTDSTENAYNLAQQMDLLNSERQSLTKKFIEEAEKQIDDEVLNNKVIFTYGKDWPEGIVGLIAGRLSQKYNRPVLAGSLLEDGTIKGSARSPEVLNIAQALKSLDQHLLKHGGHSGAAGFTLQHSALSEFLTDLYKIAKENLKEEDLEEKLYIDGIANFNNLSLEYIQKLSDLEPFGYKNHQPIIAIKNLSVKDYSILGKDRNHLKLLLSNNNQLIESIAFNKANEFKKFINYEKRIDVAGTLDIDEWKGMKKISFKISDIQNSSL